MSGRDFTRRQTLALGSALVASSIAPGAVHALMSADFNHSPMPAQPRYDPITGLPGEQIFIERIRELEAMKADTFLGISVAVIDIQGFGRFGRIQGDTDANVVAIVIRNRLYRHLWQHHDVLARLRCDQFGLLFTTDNQNLIAGDLASMQQSLRVPFRIRNRENVLTTHIGAMRKQAHVHLAPDLIAMARQAAVNVRREGGNGPHFYDVGIVG